MLAGGPESRAEVAAGGAAALLLSPTSAALGPPPAALGNSSRHQATLSPLAPLLAPEPGSLPRPVAFSHQVLLPPAVAIRDLSLRPAAPAAQATLPPPAHLATSGAGGCSAFAFQEAPRHQPGVRWPVRKLAMPVPAHPVVRTVAAGREGRSTTGPTLPLNRAGSASCLSPAVRRCPGERGRPEHGSLGQSETPPTVTAGQFRLRLQFNSMLQSGRQSDRVGGTEQQPPQVREHGRQNRVAGRFGASRCYHVVPQRLPTPHRAAYRAAAHGGRGRGHWGH